MSWLDIVRIATFAFTLLCSLLALALSGNVTSFSTSFYHVFFNYAAMAIAVGVISLLTVGVMLVMDFFRTGAFTSMILVELIWFSVLQLLWLVVGALAAETVSDFFDGTCAWTPDEVGTACQETQAVAAFAFLACFTLSTYTTIILVMAIMRHNRGTPVWKSSVKQGLVSNLQQYSEAKSANASAQYLYPPPSGIPAAPVAPQGYPEV